MCSLFLLALQLFYSDKGDKEEIKLDQTRSSVNLPFHSFSARDEQPKAVKEVKVEPVTSSKNLQSLSFTCGEQPKPVAEESKVLEVQSEEPPAEPSARSNTKDVIMLEDDVNEDESTNDNLEKTNVPREDDSAEPASEMDEQVEPMSLSDLSTSFQECLQSVNKNRKPGKLEKSENKSFCCTLYRY
ncbi:protein RRP6-like 2 [Pistacia vera]|uniref:protein RRP6-like 2 n=1 Tax=Pistacia vera TaxID=55513 RepID=UPI00126326CA|nr:protein RRP6-like 2 [Pistacia vera]